MNTKLLDNTFEKAKLGFYCRFTQSYETEWSFISDKLARENISSQLQYLEWTIKIYNKYKFGSNVGSMHFKNINIIVFGVAELALFGMIPNAKERYRQEKNIQEKYESYPDSCWIIDTAFSEGTITREIKNTLHELRKDRNQIHLSSLAVREYDKYKIDDANNSIKLLDELREHLSSKLLPTKTNPE